MYNILLNTIRERAAFKLSALARRLDPQAERRKLLLHYETSETVDSDIVEQGSEAARASLESWFRIYDTADRMINRHCHAYYKHCHPKHYMWANHNAYILDRVRPGDRVLDVGCSNSAYAQDMAAIARQVTCIDIKPEAVEACRAQNTQPNVRYEVCDVTTELPDGEFDVAVCSHVLEHLDDPVAVLRTLAASVPRLVVKVPLDDSTWQKVVKRDIGMFWMATDDHRREYTKEMLTEQLVEGGWRVQDMVRGSDLRAESTSIALEKRLAA